MCNPFSESLHDIFGLPGVAVADVADLHVLGPVGADEHVAGGPVHHGAGHGASPPVTGEPARPALAPEAAPLGRMRIGGGLLAASTRPPDWPRSFLGGRAGLG